MNGHISIVDVEEPVLEAGTEGLAQLHPWHGLEELYASRDDL